MIDEFITLLANLGAIDSRRAITIRFLRDSFPSRDKDLETLIPSLKEAGYITQLEDKIFLTQNGLLRAMSRFS